MTTNTDLHVAMPELLQSCRGSVKADLMRYEQMVLSCNYTETRAVYQVEADRLRALLDSIDARATIQQAAVPEGLPQAVLTLNAAWNRKEPEEAIAGHMDLCRRLALAAVPPKQQPTGVRCHNDACCGGQLPCPTKEACGVTS